MFTLIFRQFFGSISYHGSVPCVLIEIIHTQNIQFVLYFLKSPRDCDPYQYIKCSFSTVIDKEIIET